ncbi:MAG: 1-deoxy-D-xylulose-5-phosphate reductoisomerase [Dehalococcoidia bacterium]
MKSIRVAVLGSTGSIGTQTLDVIRALPERFNVVALAAGSNVTLLEEQAREFRPRMIWSAREEDFISDRINDGRISARWTEMEEMASHRDVDLIVVATTGAAGLAPSLAAARAGKAIAIANKEVLVMAGHIITNEARRSGADIRPVDSEHSAIWQCLWGEKTESIDRLVITASGGALRDVPDYELERVTAEQALRHPNWQMGQKITVDSATLLNKGLECIEAMWLFNVPMERIEVVLHRESIIHSLVEFCDGSVKAQLGVPDMRLPIQCALTYPERVAGMTVPRLDLKMIGNLSFDVPQANRFPCLALALQAGRTGGTAPAVLAAADEVAVHYFLSNYIGFTEIAHVIDDTLNAHPPIANPSLEQVLEADRWAREYSNDWVRAKV